MGPKMTTVGELRKALAHYTDETSLYFGYGDLSFYRATPHGSGQASAVQIEFKEIYDTQKKADLID